MDYARSPHSPVVNVALIDELERSREEEAERARRARMAEITRSAGEATAVATAAAAVAGATAVASAVRRQLQQRRDLPRAPSQTPFYPDPSPTAPRRTTRSRRRSWGRRSREVDGPDRPGARPAGGLMSSRKSQNANVADVHIVCGAGRGGPAGVASRAKHREPVLTLSWLSSWL